MLKPTSLTLPVGKTDSVLTVSDEVAATKYGQTWTQLNYGENTMVYIPYGILWYIIPYGIHTICCISIIIPVSPLWHNTPCSTSPQLYSSMLWCIISVAIWSLGGCHATTVDISRSR